MKRYYSLTAIVAIMFCACTSDHSIEGTPGEFIEGYNTLIDISEAFSREFYRKLGEEELKTEHFVDPSLSNVHVLQGSNISKVRQLIESGKKKGSDLPIVLHADSALLAVDSVRAIFTETNNYLEGREYKSDNWAKGQAYYKSMNHWKNVLYRSMQGMSDVLSAQEAEREMKELASFKNKEGFAYRYRVYNYAMKQYHNGCNGEHREQLLQNLEDEMKVLDNFINSNRAHQYHDLFTSYSAQAQSYLNTAKRLHLEINSNDDVTSTLDLLVTYYNSIVSISNTILDLEANDLIS